MNRISKSHLFGTTLTAHQASSCPILRNPVHPVSLTYANQFKAQPGALQGAAQRAVFGPGERWISLDQMEGGLAGLRQNVHVAHDVGDIEFGHPALRSEERR